MALSLEDLCFNPQFDAQEATLNTRLESLRELAHSLLADLDSLARLATPPKNIHPNLHEEVRRFEISLITMALETCRGNQARAARLLGIKHTTLHAKLKRYQIRYADRPHLEATALNRELSI